MIQPMQLPYSLNALEPYYSSQTLNIHYNVLYKNYVQTYNSIQNKLQIMRSTNDFTNIKCLEKDLSFNGSGVILHELFFNNLGPVSHIKPSKSLLEQISRDFGSFELFKKQFFAASKTVEASGWCLLVWTHRFKKLEILQCEKHQNLTLWGCIPILVLDMWEHSYFLQYYADRAKYIDSFWNIINWNVVNKRWE